MNAIQGLSPRQVNYLGMALLSGMLAMPIAMLLTKLMATTEPPLMVAPAPSEPLEHARSSMPKEAVPAAILPTQSLPMPSAPSVAAPAEILPETIPPVVAPPMDAPSIPVPPFTQGAPSVVPALSGSLPLAPPGAKSSTHVPLTPHAAVVALMQVMSEASVKAQAARHVLKSVAAATRAGHALQKPSTAKPIPPGVKASAIDPVTPNFGVIGGPTASKAATPGLNGTGMRHRL